MRRSNGNGPANGGSRDRGMLLPLPPRRGTPGLELPTRSSNESPDKLTRLRKCSSLNITQEESSKLATLESIVNAQAAALAGVDTTLKKLLEQVDSLIGQHGSLEEDVKELEMVGSLWIKITDRMDKVEAAQSKLAADAEASRVTQATLEKHVQQLLEGLQQHQQHQQVNSQGAQASAQQLAALEQHFKTLETACQKQQTQLEEHQRVYKTVASSTQLGVLEQQVKSLDAELQQQRQQMEEQCKDLESSTAAQVAELNRQVAELAGGMHRQAQQEQQAKASATKLLLGMLDKQVAALEESLAAQEQAMQDVKKQLAQQDQQLSGSCVWQEALGALQQQVEALKQEQAQAASGAASSLAAVRKQVKECEGFLELEKSQQHILNMEVSAQLVTLEKQLREVEQQRKPPPLQPSASLRGGSTALYVALERQVSDLGSQLQQVQQEQQAIKQQQEAKEHAGRGSAGAGSSVDLHTQITALAKRVKDVESQQTKAEEQQQQQQDAARNKVSQLNSLERAVREVEKAMHALEQQHSNDAIDLRLNVAALERQLKEHGAQKRRAGEDDDTLVQKLDEALDAVVVCNALKATCMDLAVGVEQLQMQQEQTAQQVSELVQQRGEPAEAVEDVKEGLADALQRLAALELGIGSCASSPRKRVPEVHEVEASLLERMDERDASLVQLKKTVDLIVADLNKLSQKHIQARADRGDGDCSLPGGRSLASVAGVTSFQPFTLTSVLQNCVTYDEAMDRFARKSSLKEAFEKARRNEDLIIKVMKEVEFKLKERIEVLSKGLLKTAQQVDTLHNELRDRELSSTGNMGLTEAGIRPSLLAVSSMVRSSSIKALLANHNSKGETAVDKALRAMGRRGEDRDKTEAGLSSMLQPADSFGRVRDWADRASPASFEATGSLSKRDSGLKLDKERVSPSGYDRSSSHRRVKERVSPSYLLRRGL